MYDLDDSVLLTRNSSLSVFLLLLLCIVCGCKITTDLSVKIFCTFNVGILLKIAHHTWQLFRQSKVHMIRFLSTFHCRLVWHHHFGLKSGRSIYTASCIRKRALPFLHFTSCSSYVEGKCLFVDATEQLLGVSKSLPSYTPSIYNRI